MEPSLSPISPQPDSPLRGTGRLMLLGCLSIIGYGTMALGSGERLNPQSPDPLAIHRFLQIDGFLFVCYWMLIAPLATGRRMDPRHLWFAIAFALLFRALLLPTDPILDHSLYRSMWDGHVGMEGINPYRHPPQSDELLSIRTDYWQKIPERDSLSTNPPTLQFIFAISESLYPGSLIGMKFFILIFDIGTIFLLMATLEWIKRPPEWCLIYAWSPLVIQGIANSGNSAVVSAFGLALTMLWIVKGKQCAIGLTMAALTLSRLGTALFLPLLHRFWKGSHYVIFASGLLLLLLPFMTGNVNPFAGWISDATERQFNGGLHSLLEFVMVQMGGKVAENSAALTRLFLFSIVLVVTLWQTILLVWRRESVDLLRAFFSVLGTLILCSPVIDPGSLIALIPLLCIFPNRAWILLSGLIVLSNLYYENHVFPPWVMGVEFGVFFYVGMIEYLIGRVRWGVIGERILTQDSPIKKENP